MPMEELPGTKLLMVCVYFESIIRLQKCGIHLQKASYQHKWMLAQNEELFSVLFPDTQIIILKTYGIVIELEALPALAKLGPQGTYPRRIRVGVKRGYM